MSKHLFIKQAAIEAGFDACGIAKAESLDEDAAFMQHWLSEGKHGEMHYLARNFDKRTDPRVLVPGCRSVVVVLLNYFPEDLQPDTAPRIAKYAYPETDYHSVIKEKLASLEALITAAYGPESVASKHQHRFVDSAPILERRWAQRAGLGWIGKNTLLINPDFGSYCFIGILLLNIEVETYDKPIPDRCGTCTRCINACPTAALESYSMDARRCLSYLSIELKDEIPETFQHSVSGQILGCDICSDVCPWNRKKAHPHKHPELKAHTGILQWSQQDWMNMNETDFELHFPHSALRRAGFRKLQQNLRLGKKKQNPEDNANTENEQA